MADDIAEVTIPEGHDLVDAPLPHADLGQASGTPLSDSAGILGAKADSDPRAITKNDESTVYQRVAWKPAPDFTKPPKRRGIGGIRRIGGISPPSRSQCARVPQEGSVKLHFDKIVRPGTILQNVEIEYSLLPPVHKLVCCWNSEKGKSNAKHLYVVIGIFSGIDVRPKERVVLIKNKAHLFRTLYWNCIRLRGLRFLFSLKDVKKFRLYECNWLMGTHTRIEIDYHGERILYQLWGTFQKLWTSRRENKEWAHWIHENLNSNSYQPDYPAVARIAEMNHFDEFGMWQPRPDHQEHDKDCALSLELVLGWSAYRISIAVSIPVVLSLVIGLWYQKTTGDIATAWVLGTYVVTSAGIIAALLALLTGLESKA